MKDSDSGKLVQTGFKALLISLLIILAIAFFPSIDSFAASPVNMDDVTLEMTSAATFYKKASKSPTTFVVKMNVNGGDEHVFNKKTDFVSVKLKTSKAYKNRVFLKKIKLSKNVLKIYLTAYDTAKVKLRVTLNDKKFDYVTLKFFSMTMDSSMNMTAGSSAKLKVYKCMLKNYKKYGGKVKWSSSRKSVATINSRGKISAKKSGKTTITAKVGKAKLKCTLSVSSPANTSSTVKNTQTSNATQVSNTTNTGSSVSSAKGEDIVAFAMQYIGVPYVYGGDDLNTGVDCSGFTQQVYFNFGYYDIPRVAEDQAGYGVAVNVSTDTLLPGDLLFYGDSYGIDHVGLYIGNGQIIHASSSGVKISNYNYKTPVCARRIV